MSRAARCMLVAVIAVSMTFMPAVTSAETWNPFRDVPAEFSLPENVQDLLRRIVDAITEAAGRVVSKFRIPDPDLLGAQPTSAYTPPRFRLGDAVAIGASLKTSLLVPTPAPSDAPSNAGAYWASDCSCHRGEACPDNSGRLCEQCRSITIGDKKTSAAECRQDIHAPNAGGGSPQLRGHF